MDRIVKACIRNGNNVTDAFICQKGLKQGEITSPLFFRCLVNELARYIIKTGRHGIQLYLIWLNYSFCFLQTTLFFYQIQWLGFKTKMFLLEIVPDFISMLTWTNQTLWFSEMVDTFPRRKKYIMGKTVQLLTLTNAWAFSLRLKWRSQMLWTKWPLKQGKGLLTYSERYGGLGIFRQQYF